MRRCMLVMALVLMTTGGARAAGLALDGDQFWVVLASRQDPDQAIAEARRYAQASARVVRSSNGWYAVVLGPRKVAPGGGAALLASLSKAYSIPNDARLSRGDKFTETVWTAPAPAAIRTVHYDGKTDAVLEEHDLRLTLSKASPGGQDENAPVARGTFRGKGAFSIIVADNTAEAPASDASLVVLDKSSPSPQVVFTYFWQGAHCCTVTRIATENAEGKWSVIDGETLDGDAGYAFEDLDGSGEQQLLSDDNAFYYAFSSFAESVAPTRIHRLIGGKLVDVTTDPRYLHRLLQSLYLMESYASPDSWKSTGFLAGWVAAKILVGQGPEAWQRMLSSYVDNPDFGPQRCAGGKPLDKCPDDQKSHVPFPIALRQFLVEHGYVSEPELYPVPDKVALRPATAPAASIPDGPMGRCVESGDTVRKLVFQMFAGRRMRDGESDEDVTLDDDTTVEGTDTGIGKVTCAVTVSIDAKGLVGKLAQAGDIRQAGAVFGLLQRKGPKLSNRVRFTVKPTAKEGQSYVELLPFR